MLSTRLVCSQGGWWYPDPAIKMAGYVNLMPPAYVCRRHIIGVASQFIGWGDGLAG